MHAIDLALARTEVEMANSRRRLASAEELLVTGSMHITRMSRFRGRLASVSALLQSTKEVLYDTFLLSVNQCGSEGLTLGPCPCVCHIVETRRRNPRCT